MDNVVVIEAALTCPPSMIGTIRSVILYSTICMDCTTIFAVNKEERDMYWEWLKTNHLLDFSKELVFIGDSMYARNLLCSSSNTWVKWEKANWEHILELSKITPENLSGIISLL